MANGFLPGLEEEEQALKQGTLPGTPMRPEAQSASQPQATSRIAPAPPRESFMEGFKRNMRRLHDPEGVAQERKDLEAARAQNAKAELEDPGSSQSKKAREALGKLFPSLKNRTEGMSAAQIMQFKIGELGAAEAKAKQSHEGAMELEGLRGRNALEVARERERAAAKLAAQKAADKPSAFAQTLDKKDAELYQKQLQQLPDLSNRIKNLDEAVAIANKVITGPLAGNDKVYFGQKLARQDAQRLEQFLSEENVRLIMQFAKEAGVRSIDTESEQKRLLQSIANKEMSTPVLKQTLAKMKRIASDAQRIIRAKHAYVQEHGSLQGFNPEKALVGDTKTIKGVTYERRADGKWYPAR